MLGLSRKRGESVEIRVPGLKEPIRVKVVAVGHRGDVRLGFDAPREVLIDRPEAADRLQSWRAKKNGN